MTITTVDIPDEKWQKFKIKVIKNYGNYTLTKVVEKMIDMFLTGETKIHINDLITYNRIEKLSKQKISHRKKKMVKTIPAKFLNMWVAVRGDKIKIASMNESDTRRLALQDYGDAVRVFFVNEELVGKPISGNYK